MPGLGRSCSLRITALAVTAALAVAALASPAVRATSSTGLYAPFPSPLGGGAVAQTYVGDLGAGVDAARLRAGTSISPALPTSARPGAASIRAGAAGAQGLWTSLWGLGLAALVIAGVLAAGRITWRPART